MKKLNFKTLFLIDGVGGSVTALMIGFILPRLPDHFFLPAQILKVLAFFGFVCGSYSLLCSFLVKKDFRPWLKIIIFANLFYCAVTAAVIVMFFDQLSVVGVAYFVIEIAIILALAAVEQKKLVSI